MRILGIDPGLQHTGWGVIETEGSKLNYVASGTIHTNGKDDLSIRLLTLHNELEKVLKLYSPNKAAIEETFVNKNALSSLKLGHARGVLMMTASLAGLTPIEYSATKVKKTVTGFGRAEKHQVETMIKILLNGAEPDSHDAADALAVAICHANHGNSYEN